MPVEELARRTGLTVRNVRALQARGLLDPPELEGRKGYYTQQHQARVALVRRLQDRGFSLAAIGELIREWKAGGGLLSLTGLEQALANPVSAEGRTPAPVAATFPELLDDPDALARALELELCTMHEGGEPVAPSAELIGIMRDFSRAGVPLEVTLDEVANLRADMDRIADRFRALFRTHVDRRFNRAGAAHAGEWMDAIRRLPPASVRAVTILLSQAIDRGGPQVSAQDEPTETGVRPARTQSRGKASARKKRRTPAAKRGGVG